MMASGWDVQFSSIVESAGAFTIINQILFILCIDVKDKMGTRECLAFRVCDIAYPGCQRGPIAGGRRAHPPITSPSPRSSSMSSSAVDLRTLNRRSSIADVSLGLRSARSRAWSSTLPW